MKALVCNKSLHNGFDLIEKEKPEVEKGFAIVKIRAASLNRRDYWCTVGKYPGVKDNITLGSDASGTVIEIGCIEGEKWNGEDVIINPVVKILDGPRMPSMNYHLLGMPYDGTFAEFIKVPYDSLALKPEHLSHIEAASLPLAGLTAYRGVFTKAKIKSNDRVLVTGIGGGVAQFAAFFSKSQGATVVVTTGDKSKQLMAEDLGYICFNYRDKDFINKLCKTQEDYFDSIIDGAGGESFPLLLKKLKINGNFVIYGATAGQSASIALPNLFFGQYNIMGTTMGTDTEFIQMIDIINREKIHPQVHSVYNFSDFRTAFAEISDQKQFGKVVIAINE